MEGLMERVMKGEDLNSLVDDYVGNGGDADTINNVNNPDTSINNLNANVNSLNANTLSNLNANTNTNNLNNPNSLEQQKWKTEGMKDMRFSNDQRWVTVSDNYDNNDINNKISPNSYKKQYQP